MTSGIQAVVFDMDGVLVDSEPMQYQACQVMVAEIGLKLCEEDFKQRWVGHKTIESLIEMMEGHGIQGDPEALMQIKDRTYHHLISTEPTEPRPGIRWLLDWLTEQGVERVVASSSSHADIRIVLHRLGIIDSFAHLASSEDCELPKPAPDIYLLSAERLALTPAACIAIEDSSVGARAAVAAGMRCVAFPHYYTEGQDFSMTEMVLTDVREIARRFQFGEADR